MMHTLQFEYIYSEENEWIDYNTEVYYIFVNKTHNMSLANLQNIRCYRFEC